MTENFKYMFYFLNLCLKQNCARCQVAWEKDQKFFFLGLSFIKRLPFACISVKDKMDPQAREVSSHYYTSHDATSCDLI